MSGPADRRTPAPERPSLVTLVVVVVLALAAVACTEEDPGTTESGSIDIPEARTMLRVGVEQWPDCLNPVTCDSPQLREQVLQHVLPVAFEIDAEGEYRPSPLLAATPEVEVDGDGDGMTITYEINPEARWADGRPITSSDLRATWQAMVSTPGADESGYELITEVDDEDPLVAEVELSERYGDWKELFGGGRGWVLEGDALGPSTDVTGRFQDELPFSAAPYRVADWDEDSAVLAAVDDHWDPSRTPEIDQVRLIHAPLDELAEPGAFDLLLPADPAPGPPPDNFTARTRPTARVLGVWFDQRTQLLSPLAHREALAALVDREDLIAAADREAAPIDCLGWLPGLGPWCDEAEAELPEVDPDLATYALLLQGWVADGAGDLARGDQRFTVPVTFDPSVPGAEAVADALVTSFESIGIGTDARPVANRTWAQERSGQSVTGVGVYEFPLGVSPQVNALYGCPDGPASSVLAWCPQAVVGPTRALTSTVDRDEQLQLVDRIGTVAADAVAWIPVVRQTRTSYVHAERVQVPDSVPAVGGPLAGLHDFTTSG